MPSTIGKAALLLTTDTRGLDSGLQRAEQKVGGSFKKMEERSNKFTGVLKGWLKGTATAFTAAAIAGPAGEIFEFWKNESTRAWEFIKDNIVDGLKGATREARLLGDAVKDWTKSDPKTGRSLIEDLVDPSKRMTAEKGMKLLEGGLDSLRTQLASTGKLSGAVQNFFEQAFGRVPEQVQPALAALKAVEKQAEAHDAWLQYAAAIKATENAIRDFGKTPGEALEARIRKLTPGANPHQLSDREKFNRGQVLGEENLGAVERFQREIGKLNANQFLQGDVRAKAAGGLLDQLRGASQIHTAANAEAFLKDSQQAVQAALEFRQQPANVAQELKELFADLLNGEQQQIQNGRDVLDALRQMLQQQNQNGGIQVF